MTTGRKFHLTVTAETRKALSPAFLEYLRRILIEAQADAAQGDSVAAEKARALWRFFGEVMADHPKGRPTLVYSRKAPMERA